MTTRMKLRLGAASLAALKYLNVKEECSPDARYGWHMPSQRTARACRKTLEPKGLVAIERISEDHIRYRITPAGRAAISGGKNG